MLLSPLQDYLLQQLLGGNTEFVIPRLSKSSDKRFLQEHIQGGTKLASQTDGILTDIPSVIVDADESTTESFLPDRIKMATDWPLRQEASLRTSEYTVTLTHNARYEFAFGISICHALLVDNRLSLSRHLRPNIVQLSLYVSNLVQRDRSSSIAILTTESLTLADVAAEVLRDDVGVDYHITYHQHWGKFLVTR